MPKHESHCIVPYCWNKKKNDKFLFSSPENLKLRKRWLKEMNCLDRYSSNTRFSVCEDHFDLPNDLQNYSRFLLGRNIYTKHKLKRDAVPSKFVMCGKILKPNEADDIINCEEVMITDIGMPQPADSDEIINYEEVITDVDKLQNIENITFDGGLQCNLVPLTHDKILQCDFAPIPITPQKRSKSIQTSNNFFTKDATLTRDVALSPIIFEYAPTFDISISDDNDENEDVSDDEISISSMSSVEENSDTSFILSEDENIGETEARKHIALLLCRNKPKLYLGIPNHCLHLCDILASELGCSRIDIYTIIQKIKLNYSFEEIADNFGLEKWTLSRRFSKLTPEISARLKNFIFWPSQEEIKRNLPMAFRSNYKNIQIIIDCFEIEIQKPSNPVFQTLTWSDYKKANTIKYLIGCTPHGFISYISEGFGGRSSDIEIVQNSDFLEKLPPNADVMADRGFKTIDTILAPYNCKLIRPPSVHKGEKLSKAEVIRAKQIASLRIHVERVIRRIRVFRFLEPHSTVPIKLVKNLDHYVIIAAALSNIQPALIRNDE